MKCDDERRSRIVRALADLRLDAFLCALPSNVLLLSGYWPVVGLSVAVATRDGHILLIVPEDEKSLAQIGCADEILTFHGGTIDEEPVGIEKLESALFEAFSRLPNVRRGIGYEARAEYQPVSYAAMQLPGVALHRFLQENFNEVGLVPADRILASLRATLTSTELERVRIACRIAREAFADGVHALQPGHRETEIASAFRAPLSSLPDRVERADGFVYCMSGENSFEAFASFQRSRSRRVQKGDLVLVHCNSYADGFWTDITRTFCLGEPDDTKRRMFDAIFAAREAAIETVRPGIKASEVDEAARQTMIDHGFGEAFRHATGHGVGFSAVNHQAAPRIHQGSTDILEVGMVFNIEPGIYIKGVGGMRHCDMVAVSDCGAELLTDFQSDKEDLIIESKLSTDATTHLWDAPQDQAH